MSLSWNNCREHIESSSIVPDAGTNHSSPEVNPRSPPQPMSTLDVSLWEFLSAWAEWWRSHHLSHTSRSCQLSPWLRTIYEDSVIRWHKASWVSWKVLSTWGMGTPEGSQSQLSWQTEEWNVIHRLHFKLYWNKMSNCSCACRQGREEEHPPGMHYHFCLWKIGQERDVTDLSK